MFKNYPFAEYRPGIEDAIREIEKAKADGKRFILVHAATGSGKSGLAVAFARSEKAVIITPTKLLQHQYATTEEFNREYTIFGKANYQCGLADFRNLSVDESICCSDAVAEEHRELIPWTAEDGFKINKGDKIARKLKQVCASKGVCPYYSKIVQIGRKPGAVLNYDLLAYLKSVPGTDGGKAGIPFGNAVVMDEAHALLDKARSVYGYIMSNTRAVRALSEEAHRDVGEEPIAWLTRLFDLSGKYLKEETGAKRAAALSKFNSRLKKLLGMGIQDERKFYIKDEGDQIEIKPLDLRMLKETIFYPFQTILLLSATFPANFCELLGIEDEEVAHIHIASAFPKENRPVVYLKGSPVVNWKTTFDKDHFAIQALDKILEKHETQKGIIHCATYKIFNQLRKIYKGNRRFIWVDRDVDKIQAIKKHERAKNSSVLVSPSMMEGVDLKEDLARFQIMLKVPYSALDEYTRKMMDLFPGYYENETITKIVQAYGRAVRSVDDKAVFYVLDGAFARLMNRNKGLFLPYFLEALTTAEFRR